MGEFLDNTVFLPMVGLKQTKKRFYPYGQKTPLRCLGYFKA